MSPQSLRRTDEVPPPPPSRPRLVALGEFLTTRRRFVVPKFPLPPPMPRGTDGRVYSKPAQQLRRALARFVQRKPVLITTIASATGFGLAIGLGVALGYRRSPRSLGALMSESASHWWKATSPLIIPR